VVRPVFEIGSMRGTCDNRREAILHRRCRAHGITSHFSNILGFPGDTEQYDDFLREGLITEDDLGRFDGTTVTSR
jgi:hypothetical protein